MTDGEIVRNWDAKSRIGNKIGNEQRMKSLSRIGNQNGI
jgi:hypothetical protein